MPRNDILFSDKKDEIRKRVCEKLHINENMFVVFYAPTFRGDLQRYGKSGSATERGVSLELDIAGLIKAVEKRFGKKAVLLFRKHYTMKEDEIPSHILDVSAYPDVQELLCAANMLVSDYSSIIWDFSLLKRPCFLFVPDMDDYISNRGVYSPIETWPGIITKSNQQLEHEITSFDEKAYTAKIEKYHKDMGSYEHGTASQQVTEWIKTNL